MMVDLDFMERVRMLSSSGPGSQVSWSLNLVLQLGPSTGSHWYHEDEEYHEVYHDDEDYHEDEEHHQ